MRAIERIRTICHFTWEKKHLYASSLALAFLYFNAVKNVDFRCVVALSFVTKPISTAFLSQNMLVSNHNQFKFRIELHGRWAVRHCHRRRCSSTIEYDIVCAQVTSRASSYLNRSSSTSVTSHVSSSWRCHLCNIYTYRNICI